MLWIYFVTEGVCIFITFNNFDEMRKFIPL
jgi:hypothetical protein